MDIIIGSGRSRRIVTIGHKATMTRDIRDRMKEDLTAYIIRPSTFVGYSRSNA